jgi:phosphoribosylformylglycinamidine synthase
VQHFFCKNFQDIARHCGLEAVERIGRGVAFYVRKGDGSLLSSEEKAVFLPLIHDRMTETVLSDFAPAEKLFHHVEPQPLRSVDVGRCAGRYADNGKSSS